MKGISKSPTEELMEGAVLGGLEGVCDDLVGSVDFNGIGKSEATVGIEGREALLGDPGR